MQRTVTHWICLDAKDLSWTKKTTDNTLWQDALKRENPADIHTKTLPGCDIYRHMKPWLHWVDRNTSPQDHGEPMGSVRNQELPVL